MDTELVELEWGDSVRSYLGGFPAIGCLLMWVMEERCSFGEDDRMKVPTARVLTSL